MAFYNEKNDQDQEELIEGQPVQTGQASSTVGTAGAASPDASKSQAGNAAAGGTGAGPSTFAGIQDYVKANKEQTQKLASDVGGMVTGYGNEARSQLNQGQEKFNQQVDQNTVKLDERVFNTAKNDATQVVNNQPDLQTFQQMRDAQYKGPTSLQTWEGYQPIEKSFKTAQEASDNTQTDMGQRTLLGQLQQKQRGKVNAGTLDFNSALLQGDLDARAILDQAKASNSDLGGLLTSAQEAALAKAQAAGATTDATKKAIQDTFAGENSVQNQLQNDLTKRAAAEGKTAQENAGLARYNLNKGIQLTDDQLAVAGITREQYNQLLNDKRFLESGSETGRAPTDASKIDLSTYSSLLNPETEITAQNIASAEDYARYEALNTLMNTSNKFLSDPSLAGTANKDLLNFDYNSLRTNLTDARRIAEQGDLAKIQEAAKKDPYVAAYAQYLQYAFDPTGTIDIMNPVYDSVTKVKDAVTKTATKARDAVSKATGYKGSWCFALDTEIELETGSIKASELKVGDEVFLGGKVLEFEIKDTDPSIVKQYNGVHLTQDHKVLEDKVMVPVKESKKQLPASKVVTQVVYIVTEKHVVIANDTVFSDCFQHGDK